jgi:hypothetical protein
MRVHFLNRAVVALKKIKADRPAISQCREYSASRRLWQSLTDIRVQQDAPFYEQPECFNSELAAHLLILSRR